MMVTGIALTGLGTLSMLGAGITMFVSFSGSCMWGGNDCEAGQDMRLFMIGLGMLAGGGLMLGVGIPLWVKGRKFVAPDGTPAAATAPVILVGPTSAGLRWSF